MFISKKQLSSRQTFVAGDWFRLAVTANIIASSTPKSSRACNVVVAIRKTIPGVFSTELGAFRGAFNLNLSRYSFIIDTKAMKLNALFDEKGRTAVKPYAVKIEIIKVVPVRLLGSRASRGLPPKGLHPIGKDHGNQCRRRYHEVAATNL